MQRDSLLFGLLVAFALGGCVDSGDEGFVVLNNSASEDCTFSGDLSQPFFSSGNLSLFSPTGYLMFPLMQSRITSISDDQDIQRTIYLRGARVDLSIRGANISNATGAIQEITPSLPDELTHFKQLVSGSLKPGGSVNVGIEIVPWAVLPALRSQFPLAPGDRLHVIFSASVEMFGEMGDGEVTALPFIYPVEVCNDCNASVLGACMMNMPPSVQVLGNACNPFQDGTIACCMGDTNQLICPI
jgi:hypothetical protein